MTEHAMTSDDLIDPNAEEALDCPEDVEAKEARWKPMRDAKAEAVMKRDMCVEALSQAACNLRDAELARIAAQKAYGEALDAFNRCVAPVG